MKDLIVWIIIGTGLLYGIVFEIIRRRRLRKYWLRLCSGREWRERFPDCPKGDIRSFLEAFVDSFGFSRSRRLKFSSSDKVMDVYRDVYPGGAGCDCMELESFVILLEKKYGVDVSERFTEDSTLGDLFEMTHRIRGQERSLIYSPKKEKRNAF